MKSYPPLTVLLERIQRIGPTLGGVFSYGDLFNLIGAESGQQNKRTIKKLVKERVLFKVQRGLYTTKDPDLWALGGRIQEGAYVSMDSVLARNLLTGTVPQRSASFIYTGLGRRIVETPFGVLRFFSIKPDLVFGTARLTTGVIVADNEKAYLDLLYYYLRGARFVFDPLTEVDRSRLGLKKLRRYLKRYRNPKFVKFVKGRLHENA